MYFHEKRNEQHMFKKHNRMYMIIFNRENVRCHLSLVYLQKMEEENLRID